MPDLVERQVEIVNMRGLHARASAKFCELAGTFQSGVTVEKDGVTVGGCSIMGLMLLVAAKGSAVTIRAEGPDAAEAVEALCALVADRFGEGE
ncbi:MAG: HPr family phosphocarrier protein [Pseudomonadota bacterium]